MRFPEAADFFSGARLHRYLGACGHDPEAALQLYQHNLQLSQAFYAPLAVLEVGLRNALNAVLTRHFADVHWLRTQQTGFLNDPSLTYFDRRRQQTITKDRLLRMVQDAARQLGPAASPDRLVAELTFGFWTSLFDNDYFRLLRAVPLTALPHRPAGTDRQTVARKLLAVRTFRNRVYHYEPICFQAQQVSFAEAARHHAELRTLLDWLHPAADSWLQATDEVPRVLARLRQHYRLP